MAHKGKLYKQWFRRDAAWSVNGGYGTYPEAFECVFHTLIFSAKYQVSQFATVLAVNLSKDYVRLWRSEPVGGFFDNAYWQVEMLSPANEVVRQIKFGLWHDAVIDTPLFSATYRTLQSLNEFNIFPIQGLVELHFLSADVTVDPEQFRMSIQHAPYSKYNP